MTLASRLVHLKRNLVMLDGEALFEGWAATQTAPEEASPGLVLVTNWRVVFLDLTGAYAAFPTSGLLDLTICPPATLKLTAWHDRITLRFDSAEVLAAVVGLLRQSPGWDAVGLHPGRAKRLPLAPAVLRATERRRAELRRYRGSGRHRSMRR